MFVAGCVKNGEADDFVEMFRELPIEERAALLELAKKRALERAGIVAEDCDANAP